MSLNGSFESEVKRQRINKVSIEDRNYKAVPENVLHSKTKPNDFCDSEVDISQKPDLAHEYLHPYLNEGQDLLFGNEGSDSELAYVMLKHEDSDGLQQNLHSSSSTTPHFLSADQARTLNCLFKNLPEDSSSTLKDGNVHSLPSPNKGSNKLGSNGKTSKHVFSISTSDHLSEEKVDQSTKMNLRPKSKSFQNAEQKYLEFLPTFAGINSNNFKDLLVKVLHKCSHQISLDDFYNLLYNFETPDQVTSSPVDGLQIDKSEPSELRVEGLHLCHLILENFRLSEFGGRLVHTTKNPQQIRENFEEICRTFLALKIFFDFIKTVDDTSKPECTLPRISLQKAYYIICQKMIKKYPNKSDPSKPQPNLILNQSQLGKIFKLCYPYLNPKRVGKRGDSTYHYQGLIWNELVIDEDIKSLMDLPLSDIESNLERLQAQRVSETRNFEEMSQCGGNEIFASDSRSHMQNSSLQFSAKKPIYSFVYTSNTFPVADCFPRSWESTPGKFPQQSEWAKETMYKSVQVLKTHNIDIEPLIRKIAGPVFCAESLDNFLEDVLSVIQHLMEVSASEDLYLHLYLIVSTLIFPMVFSSNKELPSRERVQLRVSLSGFVTRLEAISMEASSFCNIMAFVKIMKKMINFNMLMSSTFKTASMNSIIRAMVGDAQSDISRDELMFEDIILRKAHMTCVAFNWDFIDEKLKQNSTNQIATIKCIRDAYIKYSLAITENVLVLSRSLGDEELNQSNYDLSYHLFKCSSELFHEIFLPETVILKLPIKLIDHFFSSMTKEFQHLSFSQYTNRENELSKDVFRAWWVHLSAGQEYFNILSEICGLNCLLSRVTGNQ